MSILGKLGDSFRSWFMPTQLDPSFGDSNLSALLTSLKSLTSSTRAIRNLYGKSFGDILSPYLLPLRQGRWNERAIYCNAIVSVLSTSTDFFQVLISWSESDLQAPLPYLLRGAFFLERARQVQSNSTFDIADGLRQMHMKESLTFAIMDLQIATQLDPEDPTPYIYLLDILKVFESKRYSPEDYFQKGRKLDPENWGLHSAMLTLLTKRWYGSHEQMFQFVEDSVSHVSSGSLLPALLFQAHIERWFYLVLSLAGIPPISMTPEQRKSWEIARNYAKNKEIIRETLAAYEKLRQAESKHSQLALVLPKNVAAFWFYLAEEKEPLKVLLQEIGPKQITDYPWRYSGVLPILGYQQAKKLISE